MRCLFVGGNIGAVLAARMALIRMLRNLKPLGISKFKDMADKGIITAPLYGAADQVRLWADEIGHEEILEESVDDEDIVVLMEHLTKVLETVYSHQEVVDHLKARKEARNEAREGNIDSSS